MSLQQAFMTSITDGLKRSSVKTCSKWAEHYRFMGGGSFPGAFSFKYHPWLREMHDCEAYMRIGQKSAQMGFTEWALNTAFYQIDVKHASVLYVLPAEQPDAADFSAARFDPALELSNHIGSMFSDVKNIRHKRAGACNLYIRGARSRSQLKSIPTGVVIFDEVDEMPEANVNLAFERAAGQLEKLFLLISTPTIENFGINAYFNRSSKEHFFFRCPKCSRFTELVYPDSLVVVGENELDQRVDESHLICKECKNKLEHQTKWEWLASGEWVPEVPQKSISGYHINQLYSSTVTPAELGSKVLIARFNTEKEQELYNSNFGMTHTQEGAQINDTDIENCMSNHVMGRVPRSNSVTMGVDIGKVLHLWVDEWYFDSKIISGDVNAMAFCRNLLTQTVENFSELDDLMYQYGIGFAVVDAQPERREAREFAIRFMGIVKCCFYTKVKGKYINENKDMSDVGVNVDRTSWMDEALGRFKGDKKRIMLPRNLPMEAKANLKAPVRVLKPDEWGNPVAHYLKPTNVPDHYAHARTYSEIAFNLLASLQQSTSIMDKVI